MTNSKTYTAEEQRLFEQLHYLFETYEGHKTVEDPRVDDAVIAYVDTCPDPEVREAFWAIQNGQRAYEGAYWHWLENAEPVPGYRLRAKELFENAEAAVEAEYAATDAEGCDTWLGTWIGA